ncbi:formylglycine-generating enzyme family protein [Desulfotalea psychrophila]|uniref:Sulfatase-modifying factor enzyme-like domain-containing protein n=1 Tax=Desulfotalea psychrophila (strain LSv54 / DSM 12343) TaxID=177439 RepID=Q6AKH4_DESPS|nr:formylglycine-generating enzyme family protein [Desulfotalea psychrophila]CAG37151.1 hypothetical protein, probably cold-shock inducible [Desulfotalea psychrophila LSv54]
MALRCSNKQCGQIIAEGQQFCGVCGSVGEELNEQDISSGLGMGDIGYLDGNILSTTKINNNGGSSQASVSAINVNLSGQQQTPVSASMQRCPLCGRLNEEKDTFKCRECGVDHYCLEHLDREHFVCLLCVKKMEQEQAKTHPEPVPESTVLCELCGKRNQLAQTFKCTNCGRDHLCHEHQDPTEFICVRCVAEKKEKLALQDSWEKNEKQCRLALKALDIEGAEKVIAELQRLVAGGSNLFDLGTVHELQALLETSRKWPLPGRNYTESMTNIEMIWVPAGSFEMGDQFDQGADCEKPVHEVELDGFWLGKYPVIQSQYEEVMGINPSRFKKADTYPVETVSWHDAQAFIEQLYKQSGMRFRLPTEAEWEYAARSGGKRELYAGGNDIEAVAWYGGNSNCSTHPVGKKQANGLGLYDMSGNVWEWCQDWFDKYYYQSSPGNNPRGPSLGSNRVLRGCNWDGAGSWALRSAFRFGIASDARNSRVGFRLVLSV